MHSTDLPRFARPGRGMALLDIFYWLLSFNFCSRSSEHGRCRRSSQFTESSKCLRTVGRGRRSSDVYLASDDASPSSCVQYSDFIDVVSSSSGDWPAACRLSPSIVTKCHSDLAMLVTRNGSSLDRTHNNLSVNKNRTRPKLLSSKWHSYNEDTIIVEASAIKK